MFNVHIQSKMLSSTPVVGTGGGLRRFLCPGQVIVRIYSRANIILIFKHAVLGTTSAIFVICVVNC